MGEFSSTLLLLAAATNTAADIYIQHTSGNDYMASGVLIYLNGGFPTTKAAHVSSNNSESLLGRNQIKRNQTATNKKTSTK